MEAPFKIGQKVVRIGMTVPGICEKGKTYTVKELFQCKCGGWKICCEEFPSAKGAQIGFCSCGVKQFVHIEMYFGICENFATLPEQRERINYVAVSETLRETAVETFITQTN